MGSLSEQIFLGKKDPSLISTSSCSPSRCRFILRSTFLSLWVWSVDARHGWKHFYVVMYYNKELCRALLPCRRPTLSLPACLSSLSTACVLPGDDCCGVCFGDKAFAPPVSYIYPPSGGSGSTCTSLFSDLLCYRRLAATIYIVPADRPCLPTQA
ncbi:hypothetical protein F4819DRAFT_67938 [Hypoxylon fuscum]|nr:hypothetical protein F4819DRAFT_67938 [Hypoxylon fuscum]